MNSSAFMADTNGSTIEEFRRCKFLVGGAPDGRAIVATAGAADVADVVSLGQTLPGRINSFAFINSGGEIPGTASGAIRAGRTVYAAASGMVSETASAVVAGIATRSAADGESVTYCQRDAASPTPVLTVATLPASPAVGARAIVTDSDAVSYTAGIGAVVAGEGTTVVPVFYDGTNWLIG
jgi:hypothetical protein